MSADRPGVMIYFDDTLPALECLSCEEAGRLFKGMLEYGRSGELPDFHDSVGLNVAWSFIRKKIDRDSESYKKSILKSKYGVYKREAQKRGEDPLPFDNWYREIYLPVSTDKPPSCPIISTHATGTGTATGIGNRNKELDTQLQQGTGNKKRKGVAAPSPASAAPARHRYGEYGWVRLSDEEYARLLSDLGEEELLRCMHSACSDLQVCTFIQIDAGRDIDNVTILDAVRDHRRRFCVIDCKGRSGEYQGQNHNCQKD